jgi:type III pantothenate kinase
MDVGNSSAKWRMLQRGEVVARGRFCSADSDSREALLGCARELDQIWISSVASPARENELTAVLEAQWAVSPWFARTQGTTGLLRNSYAEPSRMGVDRWLAMLGGRQRLAGRFAVIDAGSALTVDLVDESGLHEGGYIVPGVGLMERALLLDTDRVRFAEDVGYTLEPGRSTAEAVRHGIAAAQAGAVALVLERSGLDPERRLFCGGGAPALMQLLDIHRGHVPDLVFEGLEVMARHSEVA